MRSFSSKKISVSVDFQSGEIKSLLIDKTERCVGSTPLFKVRMLDVNGKTVIIDSSSAKKYTELTDGVIYSDFPEIDNISVGINVTEGSDGLSWNISVHNKNDNYLVEWAEIAPILLPKLADNNTDGNGGCILIPYNEGALISDLMCREESGLRHRDPEYPSLGSYYVFPNMISSQMMAYLWDNVGLYIGAHDKERGVKGIDFYGSENGVILCIRIYCGTEFGCSYSNDFPILWSVTDGRWESSAEIYRKWFKSNLPYNVVPLKENKNLPDWYEDSPLIVSYPIRGKFDTDVMDTNALFPYSNALPIIDQIQRATESRILVLLMHWEGTAPWAPPYVWPPFGGEDLMNEFITELHEKNNMLGLYCSGFGYTLQSNLIDNYNKEREFEKDDLIRGMCASPDGKIELSKICTMQRKGYDICPVSHVGKEILFDAYSPLLTSNIDYAQILDQNHGGGQYFCYSKNHGHPPAPGKWMTIEMQNLLSEWNAMADKTLLGCESAAGEPFIGNLLFSDNRFELNYKIGAPIPLYSYIYHEYLRNFMGNQVSCPFKPTDDTIRYRIAYSFVAGDCMTIVLDPDGNIMSNWSMKDFSHMPDKNKALIFIKNLSKLYHERAKKYLYDGKMIPSLKINCPVITFDRRDSQRKIEIPSLYSTAWEAHDGTKCQIIANANDYDIVCKVEDKETVVPALNAIMIDL